MIKQKSIFQRTILKPVSLKGVGLHTGAEVSIKFLPAKTSTGFVFKRVDIDGSPLVEADIKWISDTRRGTNLEKNGVKIQTSEHVLSALVGLEIDNCIIELNSSEPPIMDGSSHFFVKALLKAGIKEQNAIVEEYIVKDIINYKDKNSGSEITLIPADEFQITTMVDFGTKILGTQNANLNSISNYIDEISSSRTFSFLHELENLLENGLIKGGDLNNAIVYVDKPLSEGTMTRLKKAFKKDKISVTADGILDNLTLHHPNEAARHKLLDVIGDLALIRHRVRGKIIADKPGHRINSEFAKKLSKIIKDEKRLDIPKIDLNSKPFMGVNDIMNILPHRPPMLLVDKIYELSKTHVLASKNVTMNEPFFIGHFHGSPVMPGVLQVEAMAQAGGVLLLNTVPDPQNYLTLFMKIDNVKFKSPVYPGDTLVFKLELLSPIRRGICEMKGSAYVNEKLTTTGQFMAQIVKRNKK